MILNMRSLILGLLLVLTGSLSAGSADARIIGKTESGRTQFELFVGDIDGLVRSVIWTIDGETSTIAESEIVSQTVLRDVDNGVYVVVVHAKKKAFKLWMIPGSEKVSKETGAAYHSRFGAVLEATDPRESNHSLSPRITIGCHLTWEI